MAYNKDRPVSSRTLRKSAGYLRDNFQQLETAISEGHRFETGGTQDGKHVAPTFIDNAGAPSQPTTENEARLYNNAGEMRVLYQSGRDDPLRDIPSGTKMIFKQASAPAGWTFVSEDNDRVMLNTSTEAEGGDTGGSWTISGLSASTGSHALTEAELPNITVQLYGASEGAERNLGYPNCYTVIGSTGDSGRAFFTDSYEGYQLCKTPNTNGSAHSHSASVSQNGSWRPSYAKVITCQKQ